ncbi:MAG: CvpA family protein [Chloroflexi bacterium]|nr:CvpA family protein [Chloroflexota bacterium]
MPTFTSAATLVDAVLVVVIGLYIVDDVRRGVLSGLVQLVGLLLSLLAALLFYPALGDVLVAQVHLAYALAKPAAFIAVWFLTGAIFGTTVVPLTADAAATVAATPPGRVLGVISGGIHGGLVATLTLALVAALPLPEPVTQAVRTSALGSALLIRGEAVQQAIGSVVGDAVQESLGLLTVRPESDERVELPFRVEVPTIDAASEERMLALMNQEREQAGVPPVTLDPTIREVARAYSVKMMQQGFFAHRAPDGVSPFDRMRAGGVRFAMAGENLALAPTVEIAHDGLMHSPGHRANILNPHFRRVGIGVADGGMHGKMFTQDFAD